MGINYISFLVVALIAFLPFVCGFIIMKLFNRIHGIITYFFVNYILYFFLFELIGTKNFLSEEQLNIIINTLYIPYNLVYQGILSIPNILIIVSPKEKYFVLTIVSFIYILSQIISSTINKTKQLK